MTAYVIYQCDILDADRYAEYATRVPASIEASGGRYLVRGGESEALEGELPASRTVVLEFPTRQAALDWYRGQEYTAIRRYRDGAARATMYVVDGVD
jgi:uncharacterized protein (DUF1330 family)